jgi:hypothetical protein
MVAADASGSVTSALSPSSSPPASAVQIGVTVPAYSTDPAKIAVRIRLVGVIIGTLFSGAFALNQLQRNVQLEQGSQEEYVRHE